MILQIIANVLMFIPLGILLSPSLGWRTVFIGFAFSLIIELCQLVFSCGFSELDDVVYNTIGAGINSVAYYFIHGMKFCRFDCKKTNHITWKRR